VLLLTQDYPPRPGGMGRYYADLANGWGHSFRVMCGSWKGAPPIASGTANVIALHQVDAARAHRPAEVWRVSRQLRREIRLNRPDILLAGNIRPYAMMIRRAADSAKIPWGFFLHGRDLIRTANRWQRHPLKMFRWRALSEAAVIITNSRFTADQAVRFGFHGDRIAIVHPEVDTRRFHPPLSAEEKLAIRLRLGLPQEGILTLFVGRLVERKGLADLFDALALVPNARLIVAGAGDATAWRERARGAGVTDRVYFAGSPNDEELPVWYRAADIFVAPSVHDTNTGEVEGFGIVFLEAQASGLPVLATRAGGIPEAVQENRTALLVQPGDVSALANAWQRLQGDADLRRSLAEAAVLGPPQEHSPGSSARQLATALRRIVGSAVDLM
jgi:phosphatidylinositol alpha-1,6-mannosyltransferase